MQRQNEKRSNYQQEITWIISYLFNLLEHHLTFLFDNDAYIYKYLAILCVFVIENCINNNEDESVYALVNVCVFFYSFGLLFSPFQELEQQTKLKWSFAVSTTYYKLLQLSHSLSISVYEQRRYYWRFLYLENRNWSIYWSSLT